MFSKVKKKVGWGGGFRATLRFDLKIDKGTIQTKEAKVEALQYKEVSSRNGSFCNMAFKPYHEIIRRSNAVKSALLFYFSGS